MTNTAATDALWRALTDGDDAPLPRIRAALADGADPNARDEHGVTPLLRSFAWCSLDVINTLLDAGADPSAVWETDEDFRWRIGNRLCYPSPERRNAGHWLGPPPGAKARITAASYCNRVEGSRRALVQAGMDPQLFCDEFSGHRDAFGLGGPPRHILSADEVIRDLGARRGTANPETCTAPTYLEAVRGTYGGLRNPNRRFDEKDPMEAVFSAEGRPYPWFSWNRFGRTATRLPDGRIAVIAGEHEDSYDPDFFVYNDVTLIDQNGDITLLLYPVEDFPPTDFHTATLVDNAIWLIGAAGYAEDRVPGKTQVTRISLEDFAAQPIVTHGDGPGVIFRHQAQLQDGRIVISGGMNHEMVPNPHQYTLDLQTLAWSRNPM